MRPIWQILVLALLATRLAAQTLPPVDAYGTAPVVTDVVVSEDGKLLAWISNVDSSQQVTIHDLATGKPKRILGISAEYRVRSLDWADDLTLLVTMSTLRVTRGDVWYREEVFRTLAYDASGGPGRLMLMQDAEQSLLTGADIVRTKLKQPKTVTMWTMDWSDAAYNQALGSRLAGGRRDSGWVATLYEVSTATGKGRIIDRGTQYTIDWVVDADGKTVARAEWNPETATFWVLAKQGSNWREIHKQTGHSLDLVGLSNDGKAVLAIGARTGESREKLWTLPLDESGAKVLIEDAMHDVAWALRDEFTNAAAGVQLGGLDAETRWIDATHESRYQSLRKTFAGRDVQLVSRSADFRKVIARVESRTHPPIYYLVDFSTGKADIVGDEYPNLASVTHGPVRNFTYKARDGYDIPAYLTMPAVGWAGKPPLILLPHGGPESRDEPGFDWMAQFLASRGYAVLQPQFRGSTGFGEAHRLAGQRQWGRMMQDDLTDGVKALIEQDLVDGSRVCIVGASYGGYAALAGAAFTPELYRCAISINGVSDLPMIVGQSKKLGGNESNSLAYWERHIGTASDPKVIEMSPRRAAENFKAPVLLLHGRNDTVVPISQSEIMARELTEAGKAHRLVKLDSEDHWLSRSGTRVRVLAEIESFLASQLAR